MGLTVHFEVLNQLGTPLMYSATLANRPAAGIAGRIFFRTDSPFGIYRDTGTAWDLITGSGTIAGSIATGQVAFGSATDTIAGNNNLFWDNANIRLGIGTNTPTGSLHIVKSTVNDALLVITPNNNTAQYPFFLGGATLTADNYLRANASVIEFFRNGVAATIRTVGSSNNLVLQSSSDLLLNTNAANERVRIFTTTGNVGINTGATDGGHRLQVQGDAFIKGSGATFSTVALQVQNSAGTNLFRVYNSGQVRLGNTGSSPLFFSQTNLGTAEDLAGTNLSFYSYTGSQSSSSGRFFFGGENMVQTTGANYNVNSKGNFFSTSGTATFADIFINSQISQSGGANGITRGLYVNPTLTAAADWRSIEWSNNTGFGLYGAGTAANYLSGNLLIKTTTDTGYSAQITGTGDNMLNVWGATAPSIRIDNAASAATRRFVIGLATATNNFIQGAVANDACITTASSNPLLFGMWQTSSAAEVMRISTALNLQIGSVTDTGEKFQLTGSIRINGQSSGTAGGNSGQHLIINLDGTQYKIKLELP